MNVKKSVAGFLALTFVFLTGCSAVSSPACNYVNNCYFEKGETATFIDVDSAVSPELALPNGFVKDIEISLKGRGFNSELLSEKAVERIISLQKSKFPSPDLTDKKQISMLYGDLLMEQGDFDFRDLPFNLRTYLSGELSVFKKHFAEGSLPEENKRNGLMLFEKMLCVAGIPKPYPPDIKLVKDFENDAYFTNGALEKEGVYILGALDFFIQRSQTEGWMNPLPFSFELLAKREKEFENFEKEIPELQSISVREKLLFYSILANSHFVFGKTEETFPHLPEDAFEFLKTQTSKNGIFGNKEITVNSLEDTDRAVKLAERLNVKYPYKNLIKTIEKTNRSYNGALVVLERINFDAKETYEGLYLLKEKCCSIGFCSGEKGIIEKEVSGILENPENYSFKSLYCSAKICKDILGKTVPGELKSYVEDTKFDFASREILEIYYYLLLSKLLCAEIPKSTASALKERLLSSFPENDIRSSVMAFVSLSILGASNEKLKEEAEKVIVPAPSKAVSDVFYKYVFAKTVRDKNLIEKCANELKNFELCKGNLYAESAKGIPSLDATYRAYAVLSNCK